MHVATSYLQILIKTRIQQDSVEFSKTWRLTEEKQGRGGSVKEGEWGGGGEVKNVNNVFLSAQSLHSDLR